MFNIENEYPEDCRQADEEYNEYEERHDDQTGSSLDEFLNNTAINIGRAAFDSFERHTTFEGKISNRDLWGYLGEFIEKPWFKEVAIISTVFLFKVGLWIAYRKARKEGLDIVNL